MTRFGALGLLAVLLVACGPQPTADAGVDAGGSNFPDASVGDAGVLVGTFLLTMTPTSSVAAATSTLVGKVSDGPTPSQLIWTVAAQDGDCKLVTPRAPFCATSCGGSAVCVADNVCQSYPTGQSVGTVHASGVKTAAGATEFDMTPVVKTYQPTVDLAYPAVTAGASVTLQAQGSSFVAPFSLSAPGIAPLEVTGTTPHPTTGQPLALTWTAGSVAAARIKVKLDISHHGGTKGVIECDTADDGSLTIGQALVTQLIQLGVAGFPTIVLTRATVGSTVISAGRVDLTISSPVERSVTLDNVISCTDSTECTAPATCQTDLTCR